jgi:hypothetical protein
MFRKTFIPEFLKITSKKNTKKKRPLYQLQKDVQETHGFLKKKRKKILRTETTSRHDKKVVKKKNA